MFLLLLMKVFLKRMQMKTIAVQLIPVGTMLNVGMVMVAAIFAPVSQIIPMVTPTLAVPNVSMTISVDQDRNVETRSVWRLVNRGQMEQLMVTMFLLSMSRWQENSILSVTNPCLGHMHRPAA